MTRSLLRKLFTRPVSNPAARRHPRPRRSSLGLEMLEDRAVPATVRWINPAGGEWGTPSNWSTGQVPGVADNVVIDVAGTPTITHSFGYDSVNSLRSAEPLSVSAGLLSVAAASTASSSLTLAGGTLAVGTTLAINGPFGWSGGTLAGPGTTTANGTVTISSTGFFGGPTLDGGTFVNTRSAALFGAGTGLSLNNAGAFVNRAGGTFLIGADVAIQNTGFGTPAGTFQNAGTVRKAYTPGVAAFAVPFTNTGTVQAEAGTLAFQGGGSASGRFLASAGATLTFGQGGYVLAAGSEVTGAGNVVFDQSGPGFGGAATTYVRGRFTPTGATTVGAGGVVDFGTDVTLPLLTVGGPGTLTGSGTVTVTGTLNLNGGEMAGSGTTVVAAGAAIVVNDSSILSRTLTNSGTATLIGNVTVTGAGTFNNRPGATVLILGGGGFGGAFGPTGVVNNGGTIRKSLSTNTSTFLATLNNTGLVAVDAGALNLVAGTSSGQITVAGGATVRFGSGFGAGAFTLAPGSSLTGDGAVEVFAGTLTAAGTLAPAGGLTVNGGTLLLSQPATLGTLTVTAGSLSAAGAVTVTGPLTWTGGTLTGGGELTAAGGLTVAGGSVFSPPVLDGLTLTNTGAATLVGGTTLRLQNGATFNNAAGATVTDFGDLTIGAAFGASAGRLNNAGTFRKVGTAGTTTIDAALNNSGRVEVESGTLVVAGAGGVATGRFTVAAGTTLAFGSPGAFSSGSYTLAPSSSITGAGALVFQGGAVEAGGTISTSGATVSGAALNLSRDLTLTSLTLSAGSLSGLGTVTVTGPLAWTGGAMQGPGATVARGTLTVAPGGYPDPSLNGRTLTVTGRATVSRFLYVSNTGLLDVAPGAVLTLASGGAVLGGYPTPGLFLNRGTLRVTPADQQAVIGAAFTNRGTVAVPVGAALYISGAFTNYSQTTQALSGGTYQIGGTLQFNGDVTANATNLTLTGPAARVANLSGGSALGGLAVNRADGIITLQDGAALTTNGAYPNYGAFTNLGRVTVGAGSAFTATGSYTQAGGSTTLVGGGTLAAPAVGVTGGTLGGTGTVAGDVTNAAVVAPGGSGTGLGAVGTLTVTGNYTQTAAGLLSVDLGGAAAGQYDVLAVGGTATLGGRLAVRLVNGFAPASGDTFRVLTAGATAGAFSVYQFPTLGGGRTFTPALDGTGLTLSVG